MFVVVSPFCIILAIVTLIIMGKLGIFNTPEKNSDDDD